MNLNKLTNIGDITDKVVFVRAGMNVSLDKNAEIEDLFRIDRVLPTINYLQEKGAKVIIAAHIGRDKEENLTPVYHYLQEKLDKFGFDLQTFYELDVDGISNFEKRFTESVSGLNSGEVLLLDNLRQSELEKENSLELAQIIANNIDFYVNEAFPVAHREHMSVSALPNLVSYENKYIGLNFEKELQFLNSAQNPESPSLFIISGNKVDTKLPLIVDFTDKFSQVLIAGVIANTFYHEKGLEVGKSIIDQDVTEAERNIIKQTLEKESLLLPEYVIVETVDGEKVEKLAVDVLESETIYDISPKSFTNIDYSSVATVLWNGPLGYYERGFDEGTNTLASLIAGSNAKSIVGGGNTVSVIRMQGHEESFTFLSTGGGAMLDYLADGDLPAIDALLS